jgi:isopentenyldiphosphate isomerase
MSEEDIPSGAFWPLTLSGELERTAFGVVCVSPENLDAPWLLFEAGALAKRFDKAHVCPYLFEIGPGALAGTPLQYFQAVTCDPEGTWRLVRSLNEALPPERQLEQQTLRDSFDRTFPELQTSIDRIPAFHPEKADTVVPSGLSERLRLLGTGLVPAVDGDEAKRLFLVPRRLGIRRVLSADESPLKSVSAMTKAIRTSSTISLVGTALTDFRELSTNEGLFRALFERLCAGALRFELITIDPGFRAYFNLRSQEKSALSVDVYNNACDSFLRFVELKTMLVSRADPDSRAAVHRNFVVATHRRMPRIATLRFDDMLYSRSYTGHVRGGNAPYLLELERGEGEDTAYDVLSNEHDRLRADALGRLLPAWHSEGPEDPWPENREVVHRLGLLHRAVHLLVQEDVGVFLQLRSKRLTRNPGRWTSTASGHCECRDNGDDLATLARESMEELGGVWTSMPADHKRVGELELTSTGVALVGDRNVSHECRAVTTVFTATAPTGGSAPVTPNDEVDEIRFFSKKQLTRALVLGALPTAAGGDMPISENLGRVLRLAGIVE